MRGFVATATMLASLCIGYAVASEAVFSLINETGRDITHVYISTPGDGVWSFDLLDMSRLLPGQETRIAIPDFEGCRANVRVRYADGRLGYWPGIDLCKVRTVRLR